MGGVVLFEGNIHKGLPEIIERIQRTNRESPVNAGSPLLVITQQEGGGMSIFPGGPNMTVKDIGESSTPERLVH